MKSDYDLITIGGGLGGAVLAKVMAAGGAKVLAVINPLCAAPCAAS
jgi:choline dehydrogenase-like flavoprotein